MLRTKHIILSILLLVAGASSLFAQKPVASFTADKTSGCAPLTVVFTNTSSGSPTSIQWDLGNGQLPSGPKVTGTFTTPGTYTIHLVVKNDQGPDEIIKTDYITVFPAAKVNFTSNANIACSPTTIQFTDQTTVDAPSTITGYTWDFGDGTTSTAKNPTHQYSNLGYYNVSLTVTTSNGCATTAAKTRFIRIINGVTPNFDFSRSTSCSAPVDVNFINQTTGPGTMTYKWDLGNGQTPTTKNPSTTYNSLNTYNIKLTATSSYGCSGTITKPVTFKSNNTSFTAPDSICQDKPLTLINNGSPTPTSVVWDFGDGTSSGNLNASKSYSTPGTYTITLKNQYAECEGTFTKNIKVTSPPAVNFTATNPIGCKTPHTVQFTDQNAGSTAWFWDFGDGNTSTAQNPQHTYTATGNYDVKLTVTTANGCPNTITKSSFVQIQQPSDIQVAFLPSEGCVPVTIKPTVVFNSIDGVASYDWAFGDGGTGTGIQPSHTYNAFGTYDVTLKITTNAGCIVTKTVNSAVKVGTKPTVDFTASTALTCAGDAVQFTSTSTPADRWQWSFGDQGEAFEENPAHKFQDTGHMTVTLIAWNNGCADTLTKPDILVTTAPVAKFTPVYSCANPLQVNLVNSSITDPSHGPTTYTWDFGFGGPTSNSTNPSVTFPAYGTYNVTLTAKDNVCQYVKTIPVSVFKLAPDILTDKPQYCRNEKFTLSLGNINTSLVKTFTWKIGSRPAVVGQETYQSSIPTNGSYDVTITLEDQHGCITTFTKTGIIKIVGSIPNFTVNNNGGCKDVQVSFTDQSTPPGTITNWDFDFGDNSSASFTAPPFNHIYNQIGTYTVKLITKDNLGCSDSAFKVAGVTVSKPVVNFTANDTIYCPNLGLQFNDKSTGTNITGYTWDFGDGGSSSTKDPLHAFPAKDSTYSIKLIVTDGLGCQDSLTKLQYVKIVAPKPLFTLVDSSSICPPLETKFISLASDYDSLYWDFGDGNSSNLPSTSNFYNAYGSFTAKLYTRGYGGCLDSSSAVINVYNPATTTSFTYGPVEACNEITVTFNVNPPPGTKFKIFFGDGAADSTLNTTVTHTYNRPNFYSPSIFLQDSLDCQSVVGGSQKVLVKGVYPLFGMDKNKFCDTGLVTMKDFSIGNDPVVNRSWTFGDGNTSNLKNPSNFFSQPGTYTVTQKITTATGCTNSYSDTVRVYLTPTPIINGPGEICLGNSLILNATTLIPDTLTNWRWSYGNGQTSTATSIANQYTAAGQSTVFLTASNKIGCKRDTTKLITIYPLPTISNIPEVVIPIRTGVTLPVSYSAGVEAYVWSPATGLSCTDCPTPFAEPQFTTNYKIEAIDSNGCRATSSIIVRVICVDKNYFIPNTFSPNNDGQNDVFYPRGNGLDRIQSMRIFNRWGELVFERRNFPANSQSEGWNGLIRGMPAQSDAYVYIIEVICENGQIVPIKGNVTLIR